MFVCTLCPNRRRFLLDLITTVPLDAIVLAATGANHESNYGRYLGLLGWLKIGRSSQWGTLLYRHSPNGPANRDFVPFSLTRGRSLWDAALAEDAPAVWSQQEEGAHPLSILKAVATVDDMYRGPPE